MGDQASGIRKVGKWGASDHQHHRRPSRHNDRVWIEVE